MKRFLLFVFSVVLCSLRMCCMNIGPQEKYQCVLLCDESEKSMVAYVFMDSHYCLSSVTVSPLDLIDPAQISKVWMVSSNKPKFKECIEKYSLQYSDRIRGIVLIELKKGYKLPVSLMPSQKDDKSINVEP